jgi:sulfoxide reductase heme-binding subunit YedZ
LHPSTPAWICAAISERSPIASDRALKLWVSAGLSLPLLWLLVSIAREISVPGSALGADPGKAVVDHLGDWAIRMLLATLAVSTLRRAGVRRAIRVRRIVGLFAFGYALLHFVAYFGFLATFHLGEVLADFVERPYITMGMAALIALVPLAVTSTNAWQRRMRQRWRQLHRLVYWVLGAALIHLFWQTKDGYFEVSLYVFIFVSLLIERGVAGRRSSARGALVESP